MTRACLSFVCRNPAFHAVLAVFVGIVAGLWAVLFRHMIGLAHNVFFQGEFTTAFDDLRHAAESPWGLGIILVPVAGGLIVVWLVRTFAPEAKGHGVPEVMDAIYYQRGHIRPVVVIIKAIASSINIGSGGSVGREGPIIQMGAAFGSSISGWLGLMEWQRLGLIAAGAGAGIAATFNTPIGGILFAMELLMVEIIPRTLVPVMIATGTATFVSRFFLGDNPSFILPASVIHQNIHQNPGAWIILGLLTGLFGWFLTNCLYWMEDVFERSVKNPYVRHAVGMLVVGTVIYLMMRFTGHYYVEGVGYSTVQEILDGGLAQPTFLFLILALKVLVFTITLGSGGSGGVFSPTLYVGTALGALYAVLARNLLPGMDIDVPAAAMLGMAGMVTASTGAPVTGTAMIFEMTRDYHVMIPLIVVTSIAYGVRRLLTSETIYTRKLVRRGHHIPEARHSNLYLIQEAKEVIETPFIPIEVSLALDKVQRLLRLQCETPNILVVDHGRPIGVIPAADAKDLAIKGRPGGSLADISWKTWIGMPVRSRLYEVVAKFRSSGAKCILLAQADPPRHHEEVVAVITAEDVMATTSLPQHILMPFNAGKVEAESKTT